MLDICRLVCLPNINILIYRQILQSRKNAWQLFPQLGKKNPLKIIFPPWLLCSTWIFSRYDCLYFDTLLTFFCTWMHTNKNAYAYTNTQTNRVTTCFRIWPSDHHAHSNPFPHPNDTSPSDNLQLHLITSAGQGPLATSGQPRPSQSRPPRAFQPKTFV